MLKFLKSRNRKSRNRSRRNRSRAAARLEHLENRQLLAADVMAPEEYRLNAEELASDSVIVQFRADTPMSVSAMDSVVALAGEMGHSLGRDGLYEVMVDPGMTPREAIAILNENPMVQYASPNFLVSAAATPNDPLFGDQWGLNNTGQTGGVVDADIDATEGWDIATDAGSVVVAIIDSGVDYNHPDLVNNIWTNAGEIDGDGIDNDGNGFVDDVYGWDFFSNDNDPMDENFHGTHVAGIVGAEGNNGIGVAGTAWDVQLMSLRFLGPNGTGSLAGALRAINYANDMGADIANNSWGGGGFSQALQDAITDFTDRGGIFTAAAGNHGRNNDEQNYFPANYDGVIAVANSTDDDVRRRDSGFGVNSVEIAAPGDNILSTFPTNNGSYNSIGGTSMATPMVSGALAILMEQFPNELPEQLVERMMMSTDDVMRDVTTYGRLNLRNALEFQRDNPLPIANDDDAVTDEDVSVVVDVLANDFDPEGQAIFVTDVRTGQGAVAVVNDDGTVTFTPAPDANGETIFRYTISDGNGGLASANVTVTVNAVNDAPRPSDFSDNVNTGRTLTISDAVLLNQAFDVEGDAMSIDGFGDAANGTVEVLDGAVRYTPNQGFVGNDSFEFRITDGQNAGAAMVLVTVNNADTPEALNDTFTVLEDVQTDLDVLANDTDPNGDRLRIVDVSNPDRGRTFIRGSRSVVYTSDRDLNGPDSFTYTVRDTAGNEDTATVNVNVLPVNDAPIANLNFARISEGSRVGRQLVLLNDNDPDGDDFTITSVTQGQNGRVILHENDTISYIPEQDFFGEDEYTYTITDVHGLSDTASVFITVRPVQDPPRASDDRAEANGTTPVVIDVLANDVDVDGDDLVVTFVSNPDNGTAVLNADGTVTYTADAQFRGLDSFNYRISDGNGGISSATVLVTVTQDTNDDPNAVDDTVRTDFEQALTIPVADLLENDSDPNSDDLSVIAVGDAANGNVVLSGDEVRYTPNAGFEGTDTFTYTISDGQGGTATATVSVVVAPQNNSAPVAVNDLLTTEFEQPIVITHAEMLANDFDPDQDIIRVVGAGSARNGTLTSSRGAFTFTPDAGFSGQTQFAYRISDGELTDLGFVLINVNEPANNDPVANDDSATVNEDESIVIDVLANDSDVDGDNLSIGSVTDPTNGTARINADGTVTYTPDTNYSGSDSFRYSLQDGNGGNATGTVNVTITPVNDAPTAVDDFFNSDFGERLDIDFADVLANDTDIDGDDL
ncbi:MAG: Ig-like domain-containing protein, partial [Planctomycetota bacterium]